MESNEINHTEPHEEAVRRLVENTLTGEEKARAEANLLACPECLEEYLWYRQWWEAMTRPEYVEHLETRLQEKSPEKYQAYQKLIGQLSEPETVAEAYEPGTSPGFWSSLAVWRRLALATASLCVLLLSAGLYMLWHKDAGYRKLLAESQKKDQSLSATKQQVESLQKKVDELATLHEGQSGRLAELTQRLETHDTPRVNDVQWITLSMYPSRRGEDVGLISRPKDKSYLVFSVHPPGEDPSHTYRVIILDSQNKPVTKHDDVKKDEDGNIQLLMGRDFLKPGDYVLQIFGQGSGAARLVGQVRFRIQDRM